jgi:hypothetical protein
MAKQCAKCRHIRKITGNKKAKCCIHGLSKLVTDFLSFTDKQRLKSIKLEMKLK